MDNKGKILLVAPEPFYTNRGTPIALSHVLKALSELGYEVDMITFPQGNQFSLPGLRIFRIANLFRIKYVPVGFSMQKMLLDLFLVYKIAQKLRENSYLCIYAVEEATLPAILFGKRNDLPVIYDMQSSIPEQLMKYRFFRAKIIQKILLSSERWLIKNADLIACSTGLEEHVQSIDPYAHVQGWLFPSVQIDHSPDQAKDFRQELGIPVDTPVVLYTGTFEQYQGLDTLFSAIPKVLTHVPNVMFILIGAKDGKKSRYSKEIEKLLKSGTVKIFSRKPRDVINRFLNIADVVVSPRESCMNLPLKIFDYMISGKPIVATDSPSHRKVLAEDRAVLVKPYPNEMGEAIASLLQDRDRAEQLGSTARAYAQKNFSWDNFKNSILHMYESTIMRESHTNNDTPTDLPEHLK